MDASPEAGPEAWPDANPISHSQTVAGSFPDRLRAATPRVVVTYVIAAACIVVYAAMGLAGVSPIQPDIPSLLAWGADFGPFVVNDHQEWRLFTNLFVHVGIIHLALNLWCLLSAAPLVERLYGNLGFAMIYVLSGLGGSIASIWWHPMLISAGASGAIFGVYGALGAFLALHGRVIPASALRPLRGSTLSFVGYNLIVGAMDHRIDTAAHLGGLVSGFAAGLLLGRPWPVSPGAGAVVRRAVLGGIAALGLFVAYRGVRATIQGDPALARISEAGERAGMKLKSFLDQARSEMEDYDRIVHETDRVIDQLKQPNPPPPALAPDEATLVTKLADLAARAEADRDRLDRIPVAGQDLGTMRRSLSRAFESLSRSLHALRRVIETDDASYLNGPEGFTEHRRSSNEHLNSYGSALQEYARKHHLNLSPR